MSKYKKALEQKSSQELRQWIDDQLNATGSGDTLAEEILKERGIETTIKGKKATYDYSGAKVKKAGDPFSAVFAGNWETDKDKQQAQDFMRLMEKVKISKHGNSLLGGTAIRKLMEADPKGFEEKYGIEGGDYEMLDKAIETGWEDARLSDEDYLADLDARQVTAESPLSMRDFSYGVTAPQTRGPREMFEMAARPREGIMKADSFMDPVDGNYIPKEEGIASLGPQIHDWQYGNEWQTAEDEENWLSNLLSNQQWPNWRDISGRLSGLYQGLKGTVPWTWGAQALNFMGGANRGPLINPATQQFMGQYNVGRNPVTGRMVGGPFAGRNLPGTSMFGSTTPQEMAQKWLQKYGKVDYTTADQIAKKKQALDIASGNTNLPPTEKISTGGDADPGTGFSGPSPGTGRLSSGMTTGQHAAFRGEQGGLATLWPRY